MTLDYYGWVTTIEHLDVLEQSIWESVNKRGQDAVAEFPLRTHSLGQSRSNLSQGEINDDERTGTV